MLIMISATRVPTGFTKKIRSYETPSFLNPFFFVLSNYIFDFYDDLAYFEYCMGHCCGMD